MRPHTSPFPTPTVVRCPVGPCDMVDVHRDGKGHFPSRGQRERTGPGESQLPRRGAGSLQTPGVPQGAEEDASIIRSLQEAGSPGLVGKAMSLRARGQPPICSLGMPPSDLIVPNGENPVLHLFSCSLEIPKEHIMKSLHHPLSPLTLPRLLTHPPPNFTSSFYFYFK